MRNKNDEKIDMKYNLKLYFGLLKKYHMIFLALLFIVLIIESISVGEKFLFKIIVDNGTLFADGSLLKQAFVSIILVVAGAFILMLITKTLCKWLEIHFINRLDANLIIDLKKKFFNHILNLSYSFHTSHKTGSLISRLSRGGKAMERMTDTIMFNFAPLIFQFSVISFSLIFLDFTSALIVFAIMVLFISYNLISQQIQQKSNLQANNAEDTEKANIGDIFTNVDAIKYFGKEKTIGAKFAKIAENTRTAALKNWDYFRYLDAGQAFILGLGTFFIIYFSLIKFLNSQLSIGTLVFIYTVYINLMGPLFSFVHGMRDFFRVMADFDSLFMYAKIENEVKDRTGAKEMKVNNGEIEFKDISFNYGNRKIFQNLNLKIRKNEKIALVGHSGCGKTTLIKLLYRFYDVNSGEILVDNKNIADFKQESVRAEMSVVPQECVLFDDTIYNNVAFSNPRASRDEIMRAIKFAQLDKIMNNFSKKENTIVGERGIKLSGGEKQRVSIARAILADKKILVLDEATSSLDSETEYEIQQDLEKLMQGRTSIIIAHRLSTIMKADRIIVMKNGKIVQMGKHSKLIGESGEYKKLWNLQKGGYIK